MNTNPSAKSPQTLNAKPQTYLVAEFVSTKQCTLSGVMKLPNPKPEQPLKPKPLNPTTLKT